MVITMGTCKVLLVFIGWGGGGGGGGGRGRGRGAVEVVRYRVMKDFPLSQF